MSPTDAENLLFIAIALVLFDRAVALFVIHAQAARAVQSTPITRTSRFGYRVLALFVEEFPIICMALLLMVFTIFCVTQLVSSDASQNGVGSAIVGFVAIFISILGSVVSLLTEYV